MGSNKMAAFEENEISDIVATKMAKM